MYLQKFKYETLKKEERDGQKKLYILAWKQWEREAKAENHAHFK